MSNAERDEQQMNAIAAMTAEEVKAGLRQFGLRPIEDLPPELHRLRAIKRPQGAPADVKSSRDKAAWEAIYRHFQSLKTLSGTLAFRAAVVAVLVLFVSGITVGVRAVFDFFAEPKDGVSFVGFTPDEVRQLRAAMSSKFSPRCTEAFRSASLRSPSEVATNEGIEVRPSHDLYLHTTKALGFIHEQRLQAYRAAFSSGHLQAGSVPAARNGVRLTIDGRPRIFLHETAFLGESVLFRRYSLNDVLTHEFIHVGGQPPTPGWLGPLQNDLAGFEHYDEIMNACR